MKRWGLLFLLALCLAPVAWAQPAKAPKKLVQGQDYFLLPKQMPTTPGRLDVIYFFSYGSPWSQQVDPLIRRWAAERAPALVRFTPSPAVLDESWGYGARVFFALESMGVEGTVSPALMRALSQQVVQYDNPRSLMKWLDENGTDGKAFSEAINSPMVVAKTTALPSVTRQYGIQRVPSVVIDGRYVFVVNEEGDVSELMERVIFATEALAQRKANEIKGQAASKK